MGFEGMKSARRRAERGVESGPLHTEELAHPETFDQIMADKKKRELFTALLRTYSDGRQALADSVLNKYKKKEPFELNEIAFLEPCLYEFADRMALAEQVKGYFSTEEISRIGEGHDILYGILMQNAHAPELLRGQFARIAIEDPDRLHQIVALKQRVDELKKTERYQAFDRVSTKLLDRYHVSEEEYGVIQTIPDENEHKERLHALIRSKMGRFERAIGFARGTYSKGATARMHDTLERFQKDDLVTEIDDMQRAIAEVLVPLLAKDKSFMLGLRDARSMKKSKPESAPKDGKSWQQAGKDALRATGEAAVDITKDQYGLWKGMLGAVFGEATGIKIESGGHAKNDNKKQEKARQEKAANDNGSRESEEYLENPVELLDELRKRMSNGNFNGVKSLLEFHFDKHPTSGSKKYYKKHLEGLLKRNDMDATKQAVELAEDFFFPDSVKDKDDEASGDGKKH
jgi:hypothetical protein